MDPRTPRSPGPLLALLGLASLITALDFTIVYVALPDIGPDIGFSPHDLQWVISAYAIAFGGPLLLAGRLGDLVGRRRMFLAGMALFAIGSLLGGLAASPGLLVSARILQGLGAAAIFPTTLALLHDSFEEGPQRARAIGIWAAAGAAGLSLGAVLGGVLTEAVGWRGVFYVNLPLTLLGIAGGLVLLTRDQPPVRGSGFDLPGALTGTAGTTLLVLTISQGSERGWTSMAVILPALAAIVLVATFVRIEAATRNPLLPLRLLGSHRRGAALALILVFGMTLNVVPYVLTQYFQAVLGLGALEAGLAFLVPTVSITAGNLLGEPLVARYGARTILVAGLSLGAAGATLLVPAVAADSTYLAALPGLVAFGLGLGVVFPAMFVAASTGVPEHESGVASGLASTALQVGTAAGVAVLAGVITSQTTIVGGLRTGLYVLAAGTLVAIPSALALPRRSHTAEATE